MKGDINMQAGEVLRRTAFNAIDFLKGGTKMKQTKHNITEAILIGKQFAFSMPEEYVEQLKKRRKEYLESIEKENEE